MCAALTVAWLADQLIGLECVHVLLEGFLFGLSHAQSEDRFECVSCANDWLGWNLDVWLQDCHIIDGEILQWKCEFFENGRQPHYLGSCII